MHNINYIEHFNGGHGGGGHEGHGGGYEGHGGGGYHENHISHGHSYGHDHDHDHGHEEHRTRFNIGNWSGSGYGGGWWDGYPYWWWWIGYNPYYYYYSDSLYYYWDPEIQDVVYAQSEPLNYTPLPDNYINVQPPQITQNQSNVKYDNYGKMNKENYYWKLIAIILIVLILIYFIMKGTRVY